MLKHFIYSVINFFQNIGGMKMKGKKGIFFTGIIILSIFIISGCVDSNSKGLSENNTSNSVSGETSNDEVFNWRMISVWPQGGLQYGHDERFVEAVNELSNGRLNIKLHSAGELASPDQVLDTVSEGTVEMGGDWPNYWSGKNTAFDLLGSQAVGMTNWDYMLWITEGGGHDIYNEIYDQYNTVYFPHSISSIESGIRSNKPIKSLEDFKGLKIRMAGLVQSELAQQLDAVPTIVAAEEIYEALQRGVVDAAEFGSPHTDEAMKLHEVTEYWLTPGWHQSSAVLGVSINKDAWNSLPDDLKRVIEIASNYTMTVNTSEYLYKDAEAAQLMIDDYGIEVTELSDEELKRIFDMTDKIVADLAKENPDFQKVLDSQNRFLEMFSQYRDMQGDWSFGNNLRVK